MGSVAAETTTIGEAQLYERHSELVYRYCLRMLGTREDAEDAAQTTFFQALRALRRGVAPRFEQAWLLTIARNECRSRHRAGSRRRLRELSHDPQTLEELAVAPNGGDGRLVGVRQALSRLPETQRRALLLREWQGRSYAEIAHELGTTRPAVEALLFRARRGLARELGEETRARRHAFDLASLLGTLKSALGGSAAVKLAAGVATIATVGTVAAGGAPEHSSDRVVPVRAEATVGAERPASRTAGSQTPARATPTKVTELRTGPTRQPVTGRAKLDARAGTPSAPAAPRVEQSAPTSPSTPAPATPLPSPPAQPPSVPEVPGVQVPQTPPPPAVQVPQLPLPVPVPPLPVPQVPEVSVPELPVVSDLPLPEVPELPLVGDAPILP